MKTTPNQKSVTKFLNSIENVRRSKDGFEVLKMFEEVTGMEPQMWGDSIVGFGSYHYTYASGREGDWMLTGFSPRKQNLTLYIMDGFDEYDKLLAKLGKHKLGKSCLYINKLEDVDPKVLKQLIKKSVEHMQKTNP